MSFFWIYRTEQFSRLLYKVEDEKSSNSISSEVVMRRIIGISLAIFLLLGISSNVFASQPPEYSPQWSNILSVVSSLAFSGTQGSAGGAVDAKSGASKVEGTLTVYKRSGNTWIYVDSDSDSTTTNSYVVLSVEFDGVSGTEYKSVFEVAVTKNGIEETATKYNYKTCP